MNFASTDLGRHRLALQKCAAGMWASALTAQEYREQGDEEGARRALEMLQRFDFALVVNVYRYLMALGAS
jgi:hypothetical protein